MHHELTNHLSDFFTTFDKTACRWERAQNTHCSFDTPITTTTLGLTLFYPLENGKEISSHNSTAEQTTTTMEASTTTTTELGVQDVSRSEIKQLISTTTTAIAPVTKTPVATTTEVTTTSAPTETTSITMSKITDSKVYEMKFNESQKLDHASRALPSDPQNRTPTRNVFT